MTSTELTAAIVATGAVIGLLSALVRLWLDIRNLHQLLNSRLTELVEATRAVGRAEGVAAESERRSADIQPVVVERPRDINI